MSLHNIWDGVWGWGIELIYLVCIVGYEVAHESVKASNRHLASWFRTGVVGLIAFDAYTDFQYGNLASGAWDNWPLRWSRPSSWRSSASWVYV